MSSITDPSINNSTDSATEVKKFFDQYFTKQISYTSNEVDSVVGFFTKRNFDKSAAIATATIILQQAKVENKKIYDILDTLNNLDGVQLSNLVAAILNNKRSSVSKLGYANIQNDNTTESRNIRL